MRSQPEDQAGRQDAARAVLPPALAENVLGRDVLGVDVLGSDSLAGLCELGATLLECEAVEVRLLTGDEPVVSRFGRCDHEVPSALVEALVHPDDGSEVGSLVALGERSRAWSAQESWVLASLATAVTADLVRTAAAVGLDELRQRLAVALDSVQMGSWELDPAAGTFTGDAETLRMYGFAADATESRASAFAERIVPADRARVQRAVQQSARRGSDYAEEYRVEQPDGSVRWVAAQGRPMYDGQGRLARLVGAAYDTTPRHEAAQRAEVSSSLAVLIATGSELLASSLEAEDAVRTLARLVVPTLADWSVVSLVDATGRLEDVDWWHRDPAKRSLTAEFARHRLEGRTDRDGSMAAAADGSTYVVNDRATAVALRTLRSPQAADAVRLLDLGHVAVLPLATEDGDVVGLITLARGAERPGFSEEDIAAGTDLCRRASTALANARSFGREREMSEQLQRSMLTDPVQPEHVEVVVRYAPAAHAAQVGGDWYDAFAAGDGATLLVVGDVVGHDSVAAAVMGQLRSMLRGVALSSGAGPAQLLSELDGILVTLRMTTNATVVVARVDGIPGDDAVRLQWSNAGHPPPVLVDAAGRLSVLEGHDLLLGVAPELPRQDHELSLRPGDTLFLYTDGLVERRDEDIDQGIARLADAVAGAAALPLSEAVDQVLGQLVPAEPDDDVVVLAMRLSS